MKKLLLMPCFILIMINFLSQSNLASGEKTIEGIWKGIFRTSGVELRVIIKISKEADGTLKATLDSPDQGAKDIPVDKVSLENDQVVFDLSSIGASYNGKLNETGDKISGTWEQGGGTFSIEFTKIEKEPTVNRPQEPKKPYPYDEEDVEYRNEKAGIRLAGTLTLPRSEGPFPAVVLITGSGAQDRNETLLGHKPFLVLSDYLTRRGIAVLRVDDRGVGGSTGDINEATTEDFAGDVLSGVNFLKKHDKIDAEKIGLIGHSEGGIIAPIAAVKSPDVAYIVLMAGTGMTGEEILYLQGALIAKANGATDEEVAKSRLQQEKIFSVVKKEQDNNKARKIIQKIYEEGIKEQNEKGQTEEMNEAQAKAQLNRVLSTWFRYFLTYDPRPTLKKVTCPVLALNGEKDLQVPPKENLKAIQDALTEGGNNQVKIVEFPGLNHLFQTAKTGSPTEYGKIEETISPEVLKLIGDWILNLTEKM